MKLKCYRQLNHKMIDHKRFILFQSHRKWTVGYLPNGDEWLLPSGMTLKEIERKTPSLMRISRSVLVAPKQILGVSGLSFEKNMHTPVGVYRLSRQLCAKSFEAIAKHNTQVALLETHTTVQPRANQSPS
ncbi:hypothetical protein ACIQVE_01645 [Pseudomonas sp. NPDC098747]|uniref:hypothetical protein n=1 Tax=Pseudomonas sp. NPDC098747 TaxID=3364487 RepID=UPI00383BD091